MGTIKHTKKCKPKTEVVTEDLEEDEVPETEEGAVTPAVAAVDAVVVQTVKVVVSEEKDPKMNGDHPRNLVDLLKMERSRPSKRYSDTACLLGSPKLLTP